MTQEQTRDILIRLGDDSLILAQRLGEWCGHAPILEEDIALTNISLDLLGQTQSYLSLAGSQTNGSNLSDDDLAFHRDVQEYQNLLLVEQPNGDFGDTIARQFLFDHYSLLKTQHLANQTNYPEISAIAGKAIKEIRYHVDHSSKWILRLGDGTTESHMRIQGSIDSLWRFTDEMFSTDSSDLAAIKAGLLPDFKAMKLTWTQSVTDVLIRAQLKVPNNGIQENGGRSGQHSTHLVELLTEMQILPRMYPEATW